MDILGDLREFFEGSTKVISLLKSNQTALLENITNEQLEKFLQSFDNQFNLFHQQILANDTEPDYDITIFFCAILQLLLTDQRCRDRFPLNSTTDGKESMKVQYATVLVDILLKVNRHVAFSSVEDTLLVGRICTLLSKLGTSTNLKVTIANIPQCCEMLIQSLEKVFKYIGIDNGKNKQLVNSFIANAQTIWAFALPAQNHSRFREVSGTPSTLIDMLNTATTGPYKTLQEVMEYLCLLIWVFAGQHDNAIEFGLISTWFELFMKVANDFRSNAKLIGYIFGAMKLIGDHKSSSQFVSLTKAHKEFILMLVSDYIRNAVVIKQIYRALSMGENNELVFGSKTNGLHEYMEETVRYMINPLSFHMNNEEVVLSVCQTLVNYLTTNCLKNDHKVEHYPSTVLIPILQTHSKKVEIVYAVGELILLFDNEIEFGQPLQATSSIATLVNILHSQHLVDIKLAKLVMKLILFHDPKLISLKPHATQFSDVLSSNTSDQELCGLICKFIALLNVDVSFKVARFIGIILDLLIRFQCDNNMTKDIFQILHCYSFTPELLQHCKSKPQCYEAIIAHLKYHQANLEVLNAGIYMLGDIMKTWKTSDILSTITSTCDYALVLLSNRQQYSSHQQYNEISANLIYIMTIIALPGSDPSVSAWSVQDPQLLYSTFTELVTRNANKEQILVKLISLLYPLFKQKHVCSQFLTNDTPWPTILSNAILKYQQTNDQLPSLLLNMLSELLKGLNGTDVCKKGLFACVYDVLFQRLREYNMIPPIVLDSLCIALRCIHSFDETETRSLMNKPGYVELIVEVLRNKFTHEHIPRTISAILVQILEVSPTLQEKLLATDECNAFIDLIMKLLMLESRYITTFYAACQILQSIHNHPNVKSKLFIPSSPIGKRLIEMLTLRKDVLSDVKVIYQLIAVLCDTPDLQAMRMFGKLPKFLPLTLEIMKTYKEKKVTRDLAAMFGQIWAVINCFCRDIEYQKKVHALSGLYVVYSDMLGEFGEWDRSLAGNLISFANKSCENAIYCRKLCAAIEGPSSLLSAMYCAIPIDVDNHESLDIMFFGYFSCIQNMMKYLSDSCWDESDSDFDGLSVFHIQSIARFLCQLTPSNVHIGAFVIQTVLKLCDDDQWLSALAENDSEDICDQLFIGLRKVPLNIMPVDMIVDILSLFELLLQNNSKPDMEELVIHVQSTCFYDILSTYRDNEQVVYSCVLLLSRLCKLCRVYHNEYATVFVGGDISSWQTLLLEIATTFMNDSEIMTVLFGGVLLRQAECLVHVEAETHLKLCGCLIKSLDNLKSSKEFVILAFDYLSGLSSGNYIPFQWPLTLVVEALELTKDIPHGNVRIFSAIRDSTIIEDATPIISSDLADVVTKCLSAYNERSTVVPGVVRILPWMLKQHSIELNETMFETIANTIFARDQIIPASLDMIYTLCSQNNEYLQYLINIPDYMYYFQYRLIVQKDNISVVVNGICKLLHLILDHKTIPWCISDDSFNDNRLHISKLAIVFWKHYTYSDACVAIKALCDRMSIWTYVTEQFWTMVIKSASVTDDIAAQLAQLEIWLNDPLLTNDVIDQRNRIGDFLLNTWNKHVDNIDVMKRLVKVINRWFRAGCEEMLGSFKVKAIEVIENYSNENDLVFASVELLLSDRLGDNDQMRGQIEKCLHEAIASFSYHPTIDACRMIEKLIQHMDCRVFITANISNLINRLWEAVVKASIEDVDADKTLLNAVVDVVALLYNKCEPSRAEISSWAGLSDLIRCLQNQDNCSMITLKLQSLAVENTNKTISIDSIQVLIKIMSQSLNNSSILLKLIPTLENMLDTSDVNITANEIDMVFQLVAQLLSQYSREPSVISPLCRIIHLALKQTTSHSALTIHSIVDCLFISLQDSMDAKEMIYAVVLALKQLIPCQFGLIRTQQNTLLFRCELIMKLLNSSLVPNTMDTNTNANGVVTLLELFQVTQSELCSYGLSIFKASLSLDTLSKVVETFGSSESVIITVCQMIIENIPICNDGDSIENEAEWTNMAHNCIANLNHHFKNSSTVLIVTSMMQTVSTFLMVQMETEFGHTLVSAVKYHVHNIVVIEELLKLVLLASDACSDKAGFYLPFVEAIHVLVEILLRYGNKVELFLHVSSILVNIGENYELSSHISNVTLGVESITKFQLKYIHRADIQTVLCTLLNQVQKQSQHPDTNTVHRITKNVFHEQPDGALNYISANEVNPHQLLDINVYRGVWRRSPVAIKVCRAKPSVAEATIRGEAKLLSSLRHPRVISLLGLCEGSLHISEEAFESALILEFMEKGNLRNMLNTEFQLMSWNSKLTITVDIAEGMQFLHESNVVHGNLCTGNVLVDSYGRAKLTGIGRTTSQTIDRENDIMAFASILWELVTSKPVVASTKSGKKNKLPCALQLPLHHIQACPLPLLPQLITDCSTAQKSQRPSFANIFSSLSKLSKSQQENASRVSIPDGFICPITQDVMKDPGMLLDGHSYERAAIQDWLQKSDRSPLTNDILPSRTMLDNFALRASIEAFRKSNPWL